MIENKYIDVIKALKNFQDVCEAECKEYNEACKEVFSEQVTISKEDYENLIKTKQNHNTLLHYIVDEYNYHYATLPFIKGKRSTEDEAKYKYIIEIINKAWGIEGWERPIQHD